MNDDLARSWVANAQAWAHAVEARLIESRRVATDDAVVQAIRARQPRRVLDAGCGEGWLARALAVQGIDVVGIDACAALVEVARRNGGGEFHVLPFGSIPDLARTPSRGGRFDAVVFNFALLDEDLAPVLASVRTLLAPSGALVIQTVHPWAARGPAPYRDAWRMETFEGFESTFPAAMPWHYRTLGSWAALLAGSGFVIDRLLEPSHPGTGEPLSLLMVAVPSR